MKESIEIDGVKASYEVLGNGPRPVIVMHGWGCQGSTVQLLAEAASGRSTTVYNIDLPGFGDSSEPKEVWGVDRYTAFIEEFARRLGLKKPSLIGHSFGGRIGIMYSSRNDVDRLILVDAAGIKPHRSLWYYMKVYSFKLAKRILPKSMIERWRAKAGSSDYAQASPMMRAILSRTVNEDLTPLLTSIQAPTLLIWGEKDTATPLRDAKLMEKRIPDAGLVSYPEAGHYSFLERPGQTAAVVANFLKVNN